MALNEVRIRLQLESRAGFLCVGVTRRLQHLGKDFALFANTGFAVPEGARIDPLLEELLVLLRRNDSGANKIRVEPFLLTVDAPGQTLEALESMLLTAARMAGLKPIMG